AIFVLIIIIINSRFQFQFGTIKSKRGGDYRLNGSNFNSSLVRLRDLTSPEVIEAYRNFNSSLVRLRVNLNSVTFYQVSLFQFQFGTIKSKAHEKLEIGVDL